MPPHCDTMDGPVVTAARRALETGNVNLILPFVPESGAPEVQAAFDKVQKARAQGTEARDVADHYFFETVVRIHRAGEGAPFTGLKPAGLDEGPAIPVAERAIEAGSPDELVQFLSETLRHEVEHRFEHMMKLRSADTGNVARAREYVEAMLGLEVFSHKLYQAIKADPHASHEGLDGHHHT
jgi:hypothetical protein